MKKLIALILAIVMMAAMSVVVFAGETLKDTEGTIDSQAGEVKVEYNVQKGYIVVIPEKMDLDVHDLGNETFGTSGYKFDANVPAEIGDPTETEANRVAILMARLNSGEKIQVSVTGNTVQDSDKDCNNKAITNNWVLREKDKKSNPVGYDIKVTGDVTFNELAQGEVILEYTSGTALASGGVEGFFHLTTEHTSQPGVFQDTLTFLVKLA